MEEQKFLDALKKIMPDLVYNNSLLDSESIEIPIYFYVDNESVVIDFEDIEREFYRKLNLIKEVIENDKR